MDATNTTVPVISSSALIYQEALREYRIRDFKARQAENWRKRMLGAEKSKVSCWHRAIIKAGIAAGSVKLRLLPLPTRATSSLNHFALVALDGDKGLPRYAVCRHCDDVFVLARGWHRFERLGLHTLTKKCERKLPKRGVNALHCEPAVDCDLCKRCQ